MLEKGEIAMAKKSRNRFVGYMIYFFKRIYRLMHITKKLPITIMLSNRYGRVQHIADIH